MLNKTSNIKSSLDLFPKPLPSLHHHILRLTSLGDVLSHTQFENTCE